MLSNEEEHSIPIRRSLNAYEQMKRKNRLSREFNLLRQRGIAIRAMIGALAHSVLQKDECR